MTTRLIWPFFLSFVVVLLPFCSSSQIEFADSKRVSAPGVRSAQMGDIDLDGDVDFVVGNNDFSSAEANNLVVYRNADNTNYISQEIVTSENVSSFFFFDQENDGDLDIVAAVEDYDQIVWFENDGLGQFGPKQIISETSLSPQHVHSADMDNDGDSDVLVVSYADNQVAWYENLSDGNFSAEKNIWAGMSLPVEVDAADVNGDGYLDVLTASIVNQSISWFENHGDGTYSDRKFVTTYCETCKCVEVADLDGDGDMDFIAGSDGGDGIFWFENIGNSAFSNSPDFIDPGRYTEDLLARDLDGDGDIDVIAAGNGALSYYENEGDGTFNQIIVSEPFSGYWSVIVGDTDGDGLDDIVGIGGNWYSAEFEFQTFSGDGNGAYSANPIISSKPRNVRQIWAEDFNQDNISDILVLSIDDQQLGFYQGIGDGEFYTEHIIPAPETTGDALNPQDIDGDGDLDLILSTSTEVVWYENIGNGEFDAPITITTLQYENFDFCSMDIDSDGDNDILTASVNSGFVTLNENLGEGNFAVDAIIPLDLDDPVQLIPFDFDGDGDPDLIISRGGSYQQIRIYENLGEGQFELSLNLMDDIIWKPKIGIEDIDANGLLDIIVIAGIGENGVFWFENLGGGEFADAVMLIPYYFGDYTFADIDLDGDPDIFRSRAITNGLLWYYENLGNGSFSDFHEISSDFTSIVSFGDADNDGDQDILFAHSWDGSAFEDYGHKSVAWKENLHVVQGCTDPNACNYNMVAQVDDNSCQYFTNCPDLNNDGETNITDLLGFLGQFGCIGDCSGDFNGDGVVNIVDMLILLGQLE